MHSLLSGRLLPAKGLNGCIYFFTFTLTLHSNQSILKYHFGAVRAAVSLFRNTMTDDTPSIIKLGPLLAHFRLNILTLACETHETRPIKHPRAAVVVNRLQFLRIAHQI